MSLYVKSKRYGKSLIHLQTSTPPQLNFGIGKVIQCQTADDYLPISGLKSNKISKIGAAILLSFPLTVLTKHAIAWFREYFTSSKSNQSTSDAVLHTIFCFIRSQDINRLEWPWKSSWLTNPHSREKLGHLVTVALWEVYPCPSEVHHAL